MTIENPNVSADVCKCKKHWYLWDEPVCCCSNVSIQLFQTAVSFQCFVVCASSQLVSDILFIDWLHRLSVLFCILAFVQIMRVIVTFMLANLSPVLFSFPRQQWIEEDNSAILKSAAKASILKTRTLFFFFPHTYNQISSRDWRRDKEFETGEVAEKFPSRNWRSVLGNASGIGPVYIWYRNLNSNQSVLNRSHGMFLLLAFNL